MLSFPFFFPSRCLGEKTRGTKCLAHISNAEIESSNECACNQVDRGSSGCTWSGAEMLLEEEKKGE